MTASIKLSEFFDYPSGLMPVEIWEIDDTNNPCISTRTKVNVYFDPDKAIYYQDTNKSVRLNGWFFPEDSNYETYFQVINGVQQDSTNNTCNITSVKYDDMPQPESISVYNQYLLAAYPSYQVVVKYDLRQGTNPTGQVVAGQWGRARLGIGYSQQYLNYPSMVKWRDDGQKFAVYSQGNFKSISFYSENGTLLRNLGSSVYFADSVPPRMKYHHEDGIATVPDTTNAEGQSFVAALTPMEDRIDNVHFLYKMEYVSNANSAPGSEDKEALYVGMYYRTNDNEHSYKIWVITPIDGFGLSSAAFMIHNFASITHPSGGPSRDIIPDFAVVKKERSGNKYTNYLYFAYPVGRTFSNRYSQQQNYSATEYKHSFDGNTSSCTYRFIGDRTISHGANRDSLYYGKHVKAEVQVKGNEIFVVVNSSETENIKKWIEVLGWTIVGGTAAGTGIPMGIWVTRSVALITNSSGKLIGWVKSAQLASVIGESVMAVIGTIVAAVAIVAAAVFIVYQIVKMLKRRVYYNTAIGVSKVTVSGSAGNLSYNESSTTGVYGNNVSWLPNDGIKVNNVTVDKTDSSDYLYAIQLDGSIRKGLWTSTSSQLVLKEVKE